LISISSVVFLLFDAFSVTEFVTFFATFAASVSVSFFTMAWQWLTFVVTIEVETLLTAFADFKTSFNVSLLPFLASIEPSVFFTMVVNFTDSFVEFVSFTTFSAFSIFVSFFTIIWEFDTFVVTIEVITLLTTLADFFTSFNVSG